MSINNRNFGFFGKYNRVGLASSMTRGQRESLDAFVDGFLVDMGLEGGTEELLQIIEAEAIAYAGGQVFNGISQMKLPGRKNKPYVVSISHSEYPEAAQHIDDAIEAGHPDIHILDRPNNQTRRRAAMRGHQTVPGLDRDEYPPAIMTTGGTGASVRAISRHDNRGAGNSMMRQLVGVRDGTVIQIRTTR